MAHLKRQKVPKRWPITRKGTKYVVRSNFNPEKGLPILIILRDVLKKAQNKREVKKAIHMKHLLRNNNLVRDYKNSLTLFDTLTILPEKKVYRLTLSETGKFQVQESKNPDKKVAKIIGKKILKGKKAQLNLSDGRNFFDKIKCNINDSVIVDLKNKKIEKCLPLKEKSNVVVFEGKHAGKKGTIKKIVPELKMVELDVGGKPTNVLIKQLMVIE